MSNRSNILDMYVVYLCDDMSFEQDQSNKLVVLTCSTYAVFDDRSESERARVPTDKMVEQIELAARNSCNELIDRLAAQKDIGSLRLLQSRLAQSECLDKVTQVLSKRKEHATTKIKI